MRRIKFIEIKSEIGARKHGACLGTGAIKTAALNACNNLFKNYPLEQVKTENSIFYVDGGEGCPHARYIDGLLPLYQRVSETVCKAVNNGYFPLILSGDHATAGATIAGLVMAKRQQRLGVVWIDAHADSHSPYTTSTGRMHGMPLNTALGDDNTPCAKNKIDEAIRQKWEAIKMIGGFSPKIQPEDVVYIGLRSYEKEEEDLIRRLNMKVITVSELRNNGATKTANLVLEYLCNCDSIYISFDVDSLDCSIAKGTGAKEPNGLWESEANELITKLAANKKTNCFEISEVNPTLDDENKTAEIAFRILNQGIKRIEEQ